MLPYAFDLLMYSIYSAAYVIIGLAIVHSVNIILCYSSIFQSPLLAILHDQLIIVVGEINLLQA